MSERKVYHPKRIKKSTRRAIEKRQRPKTVTKAQLRRRFQTRIDEIRWDLVRFQRNPGPSVRRELLKRMLPNVEGAVRLKPQSHALRELRRECRHLLLATAPEVRSADLSFYVEAMRPGVGMGRRTRPHGFNDQSRPRT